MNRKEFFQLVQPLTEKLYQIAFAVVPDDLQAEQVVIDSLNAYLLKERKFILTKRLDLEKKKDTLLLRRTVFKGILRYLSDIGARRSLQLGEQMRLRDQAEFRAFYDLDVRVRLIMKLRYEFQFNVEEITEILQVPKFEVIEKIHNGRFLLLNDLNKGMTP